MKFINKKNFLKTLPITKYEESIIFNKGQSSDDNSNFIQKLFLLKKIIGLHAIVLKMLFS